MSLHVGHSLASEAIVRQLPFAREQFFDVFRAYHESVGPAPLFLIALALVVVYLAARPRRGSSRLIAAFLAILWVWSGIAYHLLHLSRINPAAWLFGILFILQGLLFFGIGVVAGTMRFRADAGTTGRVGAAFILYAIVVYPLLGIAFGHGYPSAPSFGVPCPTTIFTFGLLLWTVDRLPVYLLAIPLIWALLAVAAALNWGVWEDIMMPVAGLLATAMILARNRSVQSRAPASGSDQRTLESTARR